MTKEREEFDGNTVETPADKERFRKARSEKEYPDPKNEKDKSDFRKQVEELEDGINQFEQEEVDKKVEAEIKKAKEQGDADMFEEPEELETYWDEQNFCWATRPKEKEKAEK